jgi:hypothetical protein
MVLVTGQVEHWGKVFLKIFSYYREQNQACVGFNNTQKFHAHF